MPFPKGTRYGVTKAGVRLAWNKAGKVVEAKSLKSGKTHTPAEFAADRKKAAAKRT